MNSTKNDTCRVLSLEEVQNLLKELMRKVDLFCRERQIDYYIIGGTLLGAVRHKGFIPWDDDIDIGMTRENYNRFLEVADQFSSDYEIKNFKNDPYCDHVITRIYIPNTYIDNPAAKKTKLDHRLYFDIFPLDKTPISPEDCEAHALKIKKMKNRVWWAIPYQHSTSAAKRLARKCISLCLAPSRNATLRRLDRHMQKYRETESNKLCSMASQYSYKKQLMDFEIYGTPADYQFEDLTLMGPAKADDYLRQLYGADYMELPPVDKRRKGFDIYVTKR
ncbi:MAG: LicD family protein [Clostridia bacterium]|nr:LicD family protein [Clostridia bacterium]